MAIVSMKALLETGVHFGHRTRKWNPHMKSYIFTERNGIHIIDLQQTLEALEESYALVRDSAANGGKILFVGTKRQAQETIQLEAERCGMPYVNDRWLGGTLTNWQTIRSRIQELKDLERRREEGEFDLLTKKEALLLNRKIDKLQGRLGGIREMGGLPEILFAVDVKREDTAVHEANLLEIPVVALVDTNCDPGKVDYVIPSNDDAIRAIKLLTATIADAVLEGLALRKDRAEEEVVATGEGEMAPEFEEMADEELLGEATLAKLESGEYGDEEEEAEAEVEDDEQAAEAAERDDEGEEPAAEEQAEAEEESEADAEPAEEDDAADDEAEDEEDDDDDEADRDEAEDDVDDDEEEDDDDDADDGDEEDEADADDDEEEEEDKE